MMVLNYQIPYLQKLDDPFDVFECPNSGNIKIADSGRNYEMMRMNLKVGNYDYVSASAI